MEALRALAYIAYAEGCGEESMLKTFLSSLYFVLTHGTPPCLPAAALARQPPHVPAVRFMNFEVQPEAGDIANRFEQVRCAAMLLFM
jgi:hypothetical protein